MKKIIIFIILIVVACKSKPTNSASENKNVKEKIERFVSKKAIEVDNQKIDLAYNLGARLMETCNTLKFKKYTTQEATEKVISNINLEQMTKVCEKINARNGKYLKLELIDIILDTANNDLIFRYNIRFQKDFFKRELKLIINSDNKLAFIATKQVSKII